MRLRGLVLVASMGGWMAACGAPPSPATPATPAAAAPAPAPPQPQPEARSLVDKRGCCRWSCRRPSGRGSKRT